MHTIGAKGASFDITVDGRAACVQDLMPGFGDDDRLGIVVRSALGGLGASALILAMVMEFYATHQADLQALAPDEVLYPQHFVFHVGRARGDYAWLDVWPPDKEIVVDVGPGAIVHDLLDRGITRVLVEDTVEHDVCPVDRSASARLERQLRTCIAFSPTGRTRDADVRVASHEAAEQWVGWTVDPHRSAQESDRPSAQSSDRLLRVDEVTRAERDAARAMRTALIDGTRTVETYRRITPRQALGMMG